MSDKKKVTKPRKQLKNIIPKKPKEKKEKKIKPDCRGKCVSFRVNAEEMAKINAAIPEGQNKNVFLRELVLSALY